MKYYLIEIAEGDAKIHGKGIYEYGTGSDSENKRAAVASFHRKLGAAMSSDLYASDLLIVINESGNPIRREHWIAPSSIEPEEPPTIVEAVGE